MCGGGAPTTANVDPAAERQNAADEAAKKANERLRMEERRRRGQKGLLSSEEVAIGTVLGQATGATKRPSFRETFLTRAMSRDG